MISKLLFMIGIIIVVSQIVTLWLWTSIPNSQTVDNIKNNINILKIINTVGIAYGIVICTISVNSDISLEIYKYPIAVPLIVLFMYLGVTISTCVFAYNLPEKDEESKICTCYFEKYSAILKTFSIFLTIFVGVALCFIIGASFMGDYDEQTIKYVGKLLDKEKASSNQEKKQRGDKIIKKIQEEQAKRGDEPILDKPTAL